MESLYNYGVRLYQFLEFTESEISFVIFKCISLGLSDALIFIYVFSYTCSLYKDAESVREREVWTRKLFGRVIWLR